MHTPDAKVKFKAFIETLTQSFSSNWNSQTVFGRMDPIHTFQNTQRTISLAFKTTSINAEEAAENLKKINLLTRMLYPTYDDPGQRVMTKDGLKTSASNALTIAKPPLMRVRFVNWIQSSPNKGLIAAISGFEYNVDWSEEGVFDYLNNLVPKTISVSCTLNVLHEHDLGWSQDGKWLGSTTENSGVGGSNFPFVTSQSPIETSPSKQFDDPGAPVSAARDMANQLGSTSGNSVGAAETNASANWNAAEDTAPIPGQPRPTRD
jgi:hypothetical protein